MQDEIRSRLLKNFQEMFGSEGEIRVYFAPGRVNLIGEHTDYNGGHVFPCALTIGTYLVARMREDSRLRFYSENFPEMGIVEANLEHLVNEEAAGWTNYPMGVMWAFGQQGYELKVDGNLRGFDFYLYGNIPNGSGLSSSASVEVVTGTMLKDMFGFSVDMVEIAKLGQFSENKFNGVNCGIMDQFSIAMGKDNSAIYLDTADLTYRYAPIVLDGYKIVISCSNKKRGLGDSKYNERRSQCEEALDRLRKVRPDLEALGQLNAKEFEELSDQIGDELLLRRARHAVLENERTKQAVSALEDGNLELFGQLMNESHISLRDDYEVTGPELDCLVETAWQQEGVIGSRMTGAGFGGCTVSIVKEEALAGFQKNVGETYEKIVGYPADFYVVSVGHGACRI